MKKIIHIAKLELSTLFYSPIAWLLLIVFFVQCALTYTETIAGWVTLQELGGQYKEELTFLTSKVLAYPIGLAPSVSRNLYLYLPLLTMGLISRELSSGTIKLLYSSPVKITDIVFGKFLAVMAYCLLLTAVLGIFFLVGFTHLERADTGLILSCMLGIFLLLCTYGAIGLFVSCLTSYQVVAAISTFVLFAFLSYFQTLWQDIDFVRDITYALSFEGRVINMGSGLITTKDLFYFITIIYLFLGLSILKLQSARSTDSVATRFLKYTGLSITAIVAGYVSSRPVLIGYFDATETKTQTLTKANQQTLKDMGDDPIEVTSYINLLDNNIWAGLPNQRNTDLERWLPYIRFKPNISLKYVYYYDSLPYPEFYKLYPKKNLDEIAAIYTKSFRIDLGMFKKPEEIRKIIDLKPELNRYVMQIRYKDKSTFLRLFDDPLIFPSEQETGAALKRLIVKLPKFAFLEGNLERSPDRAGDRDYKMMTSQLPFRYSMVNQGFDFIKVSLKDGNIPADVSGLVVADPRGAYEPAILEKIKAYIAGGGNLLIAGEPRKQDVLNPLLRELGVQMAEGMIVQSSEDFSASLVFPYLTPSAGAFSKRMNKLFLDSIRTGMPTATALIFDSAGSQFRKEPLLETDERFAWRRVKELSSDSIQVSFAAGDGDQKGKFTTMLALSRKLASGKEQRIVIASDADFMSSQELSRYHPATANFRLNTAIFGWLSNGEFPIDVTRPDSKDQRILLVGDDIPKLKVLFVWILPFLLFVAATVLLVRRKKK